MATVAATTQAPRTSDPWEMEVGGGGGGGEYILCPAGNYPANLAAMIDVGIQNETRKDGTAYQVRKLVVAFRLVKKRPDGKPFILAERYTWSMKDNSNFYALACGMTGEKFPDGAKFDPRVLLGLPCMVQITNQTKGEKTYHQIASVAQFPDGLQGPELDGPPLSWSVREGKPLPDVSWVPHVYGESIAKMVESSEEYAKGLVPASAAPPNGVKGDDIPF